MQKEVKGKAKELYEYFPVYFISEIHNGSKKHYSEMEKISYAVVMDARKLRHYFEAHTIRVLTNQPLNDIFGNRDASGRIEKWAMELSKHVINFFLKKEVRQSRKYWHISLPTGEH